MDVQGAVGIHREGPALVVDAVVPQLGDREQVLELGDATVGEAHRDVVDLTACERGGAVDGARRIQRPERVGRCSRAAPRRIRLDRGRGADVVEQDGVNIGVSQARRAAGGGIDRVAQPALGD